MVTDSRLGRLLFHRGKLSLLMAIPPRYATAFWPAAGFAAAAVLLYGNRVSPCVMLGSFLVNVATQFDADSLSNLIISLALPLAISAGATLQAIVAAVLVHRFVGFPNAPRRAGHCRAAVAGGAREPLYQCDRWRRLFVVLSPSPNRSRFSLVGTAGRRHDRRVRRDSRGVDMGVAIPSERTSAADHRDPAALDSGGHCCGAVRSGR